VRELGRFAEGKRKQTGRHRIERAGMAGFRRVEEILGAADRAL
jgi:hypothetical protein